MSVVAVTSSPSTAVTALSRVSCQMPSEMPSARSTAICAKATVNRIPPTAAGVPKNMRRSSSIGRPCSTPWMSAHSKKIANRPAATPTAVTYGAPWEPENHSEVSDGEVVRSMIDHTKVTNCTNPLAIQSVIPPITVSHAHPAAAANGVEMNSIRLSNGLRSMANTGGLLQRFVGNGRHPPGNGQELFDRGRQRQLVRCRNRTGL